MKIRNQRGMSKVIMSSWRQIFKIGQKLMLINFWLLTILVVALVVLVGVSCQLGVTRPGQEVIEDDGDHDDQDETPGVSSRSSS